jgi:hypothetical protein
MKIKFFNPWALLLMSCYAVGDARAQLQVVASAATQKVFAGDTKSILAMFNNIP